MPAGLQAQGRIQGQVLNETLHRPVANLEVRLLSPKGGMQEVATAMTDRDGRFFFGPEKIDPSAFYLVETRFQDVNYHAPAPFDPTGAATINLTVDESTRSDPGLRVQTLRILIRAEGTKIRVRKDYMVRNSSNPPRTFADPEGTFRFGLPPERSGATVAVTGLMNMPLPQTVEAGKKPGEFFIRYPIKPGTTTVSVDYGADYTPAGLELGERAAYPIDHTEMYVSPANLAVDSSLFKPAGVDSANSIQKFEAESVGRGVELMARLSGEAAPPSTSQVEQGEVEVKVLPNSMTRLGVPLLFCFLLMLFWALGVRVAKEWPRLQAERGVSPEQKQLGAKAEALLNSIADLDELFASRKIPETRYWKERLELKARLAGVLRKAPPSLLKSYATRNAAR